MHRKTRKLKRKNASKRFSKDNAGGFDKNRVKTNKLNNRGVWKLFDGQPFYEVDRRNGNRNKYKIGHMADGINSIYFGKHQVRNATRQQKFQKPNIACTNFYHAFSNLFCEYDVNVDRAVIIKGCWETNKHVLQRQLTPDVSNYFTSVKRKSGMSKLHRSMRNVIRKLNITQLDKCNKNDMMYTSFNKDTYAGFRYNELLYKNTKRDCILEAIELASDRWENIAKGNFRRNDIIPSFYAIGARNKKDHTYSNGEEAVSRVVHMPEFHAELTAGPWIDKITDVLKMRSKCPIFIGNNFLNSGRLKEALLGCETIFEGDWRRFDSTLYLKMIIAAISILRCFYDLDDEEVDNHWLAIADSACIKDYYVPSGDIIRAFHGLPSGIKSTNLLGSVINLLALDYCCGDSANKNFVYVVGGDDFLIGVRKVIKTGFESFPEEFSKRSKEIGMDIKFLKEKAFGMKDVEELPCFYKYAVNTNDNPVIPTSAMLERAFIPWNKSYPRDIDLLKFLQDVMPSLAKPSTNLIAYYIFYQYVYYKVYKRILPIDTIIKRHIGIYKGMVLRKEIGSREEKVFTNMLCSIKYNYFGVNKRPLFNKGIFIKS